MIPWSTGMKEKMKKRRRRNKKNIKEKKFKGKVSSRSKRAAVRMKMMMKKI